MIRTPKYISYFLTSLLLISCETESNFNEVEKNKETDAILIERKTEQIVLPTYDTVKLLSLVDSSKIVTDIIKVKEETFDILESDEINDQVYQDTISIHGNTSPMEIDSLVVATPSHKAWDLLLKKYVASNGLVNYKGLKEELNKIEEYLKYLADKVPTKDWSENEKLAYWINLYNASTVKLILDYYPIKSITEINNGKPWDLNFIKSGDKTYSLNNVENDIIRPLFKEPRIHMAVNCAAISCPKLMNEAFLPEKLNYQLHKQTLSFIQNQQKNIISNEKVEISKIFEWYKIDFEESGGILNFIKKYAIQKPDSTASIIYLEYNWDINEK